MKLNCKGYKTFSFIILIIAVLIATLNVTIPSSEGSFVSANLVMGITNFFTSMIPVLAAGALALYLAKHAFCCKSDNKDKCCSSKDKELDSAKSKE